MDFLHAWREAGHDALGLVNVEDPSLINDLSDYVRGHHVTGRLPSTVRNEWASVYKSVLRERRFDVFNPHFAYYAAGWEKLKVDIPVVTHFHGPWAYEVMAEAKGRPTLLNEAIFRMQKSIEQRVYNFSDQFIVLSQAFGQQLHDYYGVPNDRIHVIPGAAEVDKFNDSTDQQAVRHRLGLPQDKFLLLSVRRLARRMGLENLIQAMVGLRKEFPEVYLIIVGGGQLYSELNQLITILDLTDCVHLVGRVSDEDLPLYYQAADLMVVPSLSFEGFGLVTTEAMACGTPVCGSPVGGTKEILEQFDERLLFDGPTANDVEDGLRGILTDRNQLPTRQQTRNHVLSKYTWRQAIPQIEAVFRQVAP